MSSTISRNGSAPVGTSPTHPPTLAQVVVRLTDSADALFDAYGELEDAIERLENGSAELNRRVRLKRERDARYRTRRRRVDNEKVAP